MLKIVIDYPNHQEILDNVVSLAGDNDARCVIISYTIRGIVHTVKIGYNEFIHITIL